MLLGKIAANFKFFISQKSIIIMFIDIVPVTTFSIFAMVTEPKRRKRWKKTVNRLDLLPKASELSNQLCVR